jgi:uncharacterized protein YndB with AHSA1/START domain
MKILKWTLLAILGLVIVLLLVAFLLPRQFKVERSAVINAPVGAVFPLVNVTTRWKEWGVWNERDPNMEMTFTGGAGVGAKWSWKSKTEGNGEMEFTDVQPERSVTYKLSFPDFGMVSTGNITFANVDDKSTKVTWTNEGDLGRNPMMRYIGLTLDGRVGKDFDSGLAKLKVLAEKSVAPAVVTPTPAATAEPAAEPAKATEKK